MGKTVYTLQVQIEYDSALVNLGDAVFRIVCVNDRFFLNGMSDVTQFQLTERYI